MSENVRETMREEEVKKMVETMNEEYNISKVNDMIKDNKIEFEFEGIQYRVRLLNTKEKDELDSLKRKKFGQLMQDKDILMEKDLIRVYKERGIDIELLDKEVKVLQSQMSEITYKLGEALANKSGDIILKGYKTEIETLRNAIYEILVQKNHLLDYSLENQLQNYLAKVISYLSLDKLTGELWSRAFHNIDDFLTAEEKLINFTVTYAMTLHYSV